LLVARFEPWSLKRHYLCHLTITLGEITIKEAKSAKVKVLFQGLHMTRVIPLLVYNLKLYILDTPFSIAF